MRHGLVLFLCHLVLATACGQAPDSAAERNSADQEQIGSTVGFAPSGSDQTGVKETLAFNAKEDAAAERGEFVAQKADAAGNICIFDTAFDRSGYVHAGHIRRAEDKIATLNARLLLGLQSTAPNLERLRFSLAYFRRSLGVKTEIAYSTAQQNCVAALRTSYTDALTWHLVMLNFESAYSPYDKRVNFQAVECAAIQYSRALPNIERLGRATINGLRGAAEFLEANVVYRYNVDDRNAIRQLVESSQAAFSQGRPAVAAMLKAAAQCWTGTFIP